MLPQTLDVMSAWGFPTARTLLKGRIGTGCWVHNRHELLPIGRAATNFLSMKPAGVFADPDEITGQTGSASGVRRRNADDPTECHDDPRPVWALHVSLTPPAPV